MIDYNNMELLVRDASHEQLERAAAFNHTELFCLNALSMGGTIHQTNGVTWTHADDHLESMIAFPELSENDAPGALDEIIQYYLSHPPKGAGCWSLEPTQTKDLNVMLLARGFQPGWHPNWMALNLEQLNLNHSAPGELKVVADNVSSLKGVSNLPYGDTDTKIFSEQKDSASFLQRFIASINNKVVAHCSVLLTTGTLGSAGIYHVGVVPGMRRRGIGKAVVGAACKFAKDKGFHYALLNGTGHKMYEQLGFKKLGNGNTWWLVTSRLLAHPPTKTEIELAEAIGRGDLHALKIINDNISSYNLEADLTNGMSLMQHAVHCRQPASVEWLTTYGLSFNVTDAWDLGWTDRAAAILAEHPEQVNKKYGDREETILHTAVERNDTELVMLALSAHPDPDIRDKHYKATALDWARHLGRKEITTLLEKYLASRSKT